MRQLTKRIRLKLRNLFDNRTALLLLLFGLILFALLLAFLIDAFGVRTELYRILYGGDSEDGGDGGTYEGIPAMIRPAEEDGEGIYFAYSDERILDEITPLTRYTRSFRVIRQWKGESTIDRYILTVDGGLWVLEGTALTSFWDGTHTYIETPVYATVTENGKYEDLVEITPLGTIAEEAKNRDAQVTVADQNVRVVWSDPDTGLREQYEISMESGIVLSEQSAYENELYRFVTTEILSDPAEPLADRIPELREAFLKAHPEFSPAENDPDGGTP